MRSLAVKVGKSQYLGTKVGEIRLFSIHSKMRGKAQNPFNGGTMLALWLAVSDGKSTCPNLRDLWLRVAVTDTTRCTHDAVITRDPFDDLGSWLKRVSLRSLPCL